MLKSLVVVYMWDLGVRVHGHFEMVYYSELLLFGFEVIYYIIIKWRESCVLRFSFWESCFCCFINYIWLVSANMEGLLLHEFIFKPNHNILRIEIHLIDMLMVTKTRYNCKSSLRSKHVYEDCTLTMSILLFISQPFLQKQSQMFHILVLPSLLQPLLFLKSWQRFVLIIPHSIVL
jgi:hypothetical protein